MARRLLGRRGAGHRGDAQRLGVLVCGAFFALMALVVMLMACVNDALSYGADPSQTSSSFPLPSALSVLIGSVVAVAASLACAWHGVARRGVPLGRVDFLVTCLALSFLAFAAQVVLVRCVYGVPGWDSGTMLEYARWKASGQDASSFYGGEINEWVTGYLDLYPNNSLLTLVFTGCYLLAGPLGTDGVLLAALLGALCVNAGGALACALVRRVCGSNAVAFASWGLYTLLFSLSPWVSVPYSDTYATLFVAWALYLGAGVTGGVPVAGDLPRRGLRWLSLGVVCLVGYLIKPTVVLVLAATVVVAVARGLAGRRDGHAGAGRGMPGGARRNGRPGLPAACATAAAGLLVAAIVVLGILSPLVRAAMGVDAGGSSLGVTHYLMMGQNDQTTGSYLQSDVDFSRSITDPAQRSAANVAQALRRVAERGLWGNAVFYGEKLLYSFADGTFSWAGEAGDSFFEEVLPQWMPLSHALRSLYYREAWQQGADRSTFCTLAQILWCAVLVLAAAGGWAGVSAARRGVRVAPVILVAMASVLVLFVYLLLFECRARYLFCFGPAMALCAGFGMAALARWTVARLAR